MKREKERLEKERGRKREGRKGEAERVREKGRIERDAIDIQRREDNRGKDE